MRYRIPFAVMVVLSLMMATACSFIKTEDDGLSLSFNQDPTEKILKSIKTIKTSPFTYDLDHPDKQIRIVYVADDQYHISERLKRSSSVRETYQVSNIQYRLNSFTNRWTSRTTTTLFYTRSNAHFLTRENNYQTAEFQLQPLLKVPAESIKVTEQGEQYRLDLVLQDDRLIREILAGYLKENTHLERNSSFTRYQTTMLFDQKTLNLLSIDKNISYKRYDRDNHIKESIKYNHLEQITVPDAVKNAVTEEQNRIDNERLRKQQEELLKKQEEVKRELENR